MGDALHLRAIWRAYLPLFVVLGIYYLCAKQVLDRIEAPISFDLLTFVPGLILTLPPFLLLGLAAIYVRLFVLRSHCETRRETLARWFGQTPWAELLFLRIPLGAAFIFGVQRIYVALKPQIPELVPFSWDQAFIAWDRALFFGEDPWRLTHALLPGVDMMIFLDKIYVAWFFILFFAAFYAILQRLDSPLRMAFLLSFALTWGVGGNLIATMFSSAGPVYVERLFGDPVFKPMTDHFAAMNQIHEFSFLRTIEKLWEGHANPDVAGVGISAFPSMHLCLAATIALYTAAMSRWLGRAMWVFTALILIGSVHLGWHYAVDGFAGIAIAVVIWFASLRFARWWLAPATDLVAPRVAVET